MIYFINYYLKMTYNKPWFINRNISVWVLDNLFLDKKEDLNILIKKLEEYKDWDENYNLISRYKKVDWVDILYYNLHISSFKWDDDKKEWYLIIEKLDKDIPLIKRWYIEIENNIFECQVDEKNIYLENNDKNFSFLKNLDINFNINSRKELIVIEKKSIENNDKIKINFKNNVHNFNEQKWIKQRIFIKVLKLNDKYALVFLKEWVSPFGKSFSYFNFVLSNIGIPDNIRIRESLNFGWFLYLQEKWIIKDENIVWLNVNLKFIDCNTAKKIANLFNIKINENKCLDKSISKDWYKIPFEYKISLWWQNEWVLDKVKLILDYIKNKYVSKHKNSKSEWAYWKIEFRLKDKWLSIFSPLIYEIRVNLTDKYSTNSYYIDDKDFFGKVYFVFLSEIIKSSPENISDQDIIEALEYLSIRLN